jgi:hypothetical protein
MNIPWPFRNREPDAEPEPDIYLDLRTGYRSRRFEESEKNRITALEHRPRARTRDSRSRRYDRFRSSRTGG